MYLYKNIIHQVFSTYLLIRYTNYQFLSVCQSQTFYLKSQCMVSIPLNNYLTISKKISVSFDSK